MTESLARYLKDFDAPSPRSPAAFSSAGAPVGGFLDISVPPPAPEIDVEAERADAFRQGREVEDAEWQDRHHRALEEEKARHAAELAALKEEFQAETAILIATQFETMAMQLASSFSVQSGEILSRFLDDEVTALAVETFAETIRACLAEKAATRLTVRGPAGLFERLLAVPSMANVDLVHVEEKGLDLTVELDGTLVATRLDEWSRALAGARP